MSAFGGPDKRMKPKHILMIIFALTVIMRVFFAIQHPMFSGDESYFNLRVIDHIKSTGLPLTYDPLSYGGRTVIYPQLFHYLMVPFSFSTYLLKIISALLASTMVIIVYFISKQLINHEKISLLSAALAAFLPIEVQTNVSQFSIYSLVLPLILLMFYLLMTLSKKRHVTYFIVLCFLLPLLHPISFLVVFSLIFYFIIATSESIEIDKLKKEAIFLSLIVIMMVNFIIFKKALITEGLSILTKSFSLSLIGASQIELNIIQYVYLLGIIPLILGVMGMYLGIFRKKDENVVLLSSSILGVITLMLTGIISAKTGTLILSPFMVIISSLAIKHIFDYISITKFHLIRKNFFTIFVILAFVFSIAPSIIEANHSSKPAQEIIDLNSLSVDIDENTVILSIPEEGDLITGIARCKNVVDSNYILAPNLMERINDTMYIYNTWSESKALTLLKKYNVSYILLSEKAKQKYNINKLIYAENEKCFQKQFETLYKIRC